MNIFECLDLAKRLYPASVSFKLTTPTGGFNAEWLDPYLGAFMVPGLSNCAFLVSSLQHARHDCSEVMVTPVGGAPELYVGDNEQQA